MLSSARVVSQCVQSPPPGDYAKRFTGKYAFRLINGGAGHNLPQEAPEAFATAVIDADHL